MQPAKKKKKSVHENKEWYVKDKPKVIILHSGGLDSTVCLLQAIEQGYEPVSLGINYNQKHIIETQFASAQCKVLNVERKLIKVSWDKPQKNIPTGRTLEQIKESVSVAFLEGRNIVFLALACAESAGIKAKEVWLGINAIDYSGYPDCRPEFIKSFVKMLGYGYPNGPLIKSPLLNMSKPEIAHEAYRLGMKKGDTWSCYSPKVSQRGIETCIGYKTDYRSQDKYGNNIMLEGTLSKIVSDKNELIVYLKSISVSKFSSVINY